MIIFLGGQFYNFHRENNLNIYIYIYYHYQQQIVFLIGPINHCWAMIGMSVCLLAKHLHMGMFWFGIYSWM